MLAAVIVYVKNLYWLQVSIYQFKIQNTFLDYKKNKTTTCIQTGETLMLNISRGLKVVLLKSSTSHGISVCPSVPEILT